MCTPGLLCLNSFETTLFIGQESHNWYYWVADHVQNGSLLGQHGQMREMNEVTMFMYSITYFGDIIRS